MSCPTKFFSKQKYNSRICFSLQSRLPIYFLPATSKHMSYPTRPMDWSSIACTISLVQRSVLSESWKKDPNCYDSSRASFAWCEPLGTDHQQYLGYFKRYVPPHHCPVTLHNNKKPRNMTMPKITEGSLYVEGIPWITIFRRISSLAEI